MTDERSSTENVTILAEYDKPAGAGAATCTVSSLKSEDSMEQLICKTPQVKKVKKSKNEQSVTSKSVEAGTPSRGGGGGRRIVVLLGLGQVVLGALLVGAGAFAVVKGAALSRVGAGLWAGGVAVVAGAVGVLAGINDCYGLSGASSSSPLLTAFLALSLLCLACGNSAAALAATGLQRDAARTRPPLSSFEDEMQAWTPVLTNIALLIISAAHCLVSAASIYHVSRRVCACFRPKRAFDHNQFEPGLKPYVVHVDEKCGKELEGKLQGESLKKKKEEAVVAEFGSANSKEKLVTRWLHHAPAQTTAAPAPAHAGRRAGKAGKVRAGAARQRLRQPPLVLLQPRAHPASTLGRPRPPPCAVLPAPAARYATLPLPPPPAAAPYAARAPPMYYPVHDPRIRRRRSPRDPRDPRMCRRDGRPRDRERDSQLTRSLERIHRKRRADRERLSDAELKRTYTGLDRAYAEQFIAVIDETRHAHAHAHAAEHHDSLASTSATSDTSHTSHTS